MVEYTEEMLHDFEFEKGKTTNLAANHLFQFNKNFQKLMNDISYFKIDGILNFLIRSIKKKAILPL